MVGLLEELCCEFGHFRVALNVPALLLDLEKFLGRYRNRHPLTEVHCASVAGYFQIIAMQCPKCSSSAIRASSTNNSDPTMVVRRRVCADCKHAWFTLELSVSKYLIGWARRSEGQSKPVLRVPVELAVGKEAI